MMTITKENEMGSMEVDMRKHKLVREQVHAGIAALRVQARQIWGDTTSQRHDLHEIIERLMVGVGDLARLGRDMTVQTAEVLAASPPFTPKLDVELFAVKDLNEATEHTNQVKKELGNIIFSTIRWVDDLGLDVLECLDLAIEAQEKFAKSGRPR